MPSAYILANVTVTNPAQYEEVCVRGGAVTVLEGDWTPERVVLLKFPSREAAQAFYDSAEYTRARQAREGAAVMRMVLIEGV
jgi:uncharacterized protein (DUF1330 family)